MNEKSVGHAAISIDPLKTRYFIIITINGSLQIANPKILGNFEPYTDISRNDHRRNQTDFY